MVTRDQIVAEARTWLGTPYRHQGRLRDVSVDCAGLIVMTLRGVGLPAEDVTGYSRRADGTLLPICDRQLESITVDRAGAGDVVLFNWNGEPVHLGILTGPNSIIHAYAVNRRVVEHDLDDRWRMRITTYYHVPGVE